MNLGELFERIVSLGLFPKRASLQNVAGGDARHVLFAAVAHKPIIKLKSVSLLRWRGHDAQEALGLF